MITFITGLFTATILIFIAQYYWANIKDNNTISNIEINLDTENEQHTFVNQYRIEEYRKKYSIQKRKWLVDEEGKELSVNELEKKYGFPDLGFQILPFEYRWQTIEEGFESKDVAQAAIKDIITPPIYHQIITAYED